MFHRDKAKTPGDPRTDEELIRALNRGDDAAFTPIYHRYRDWALSLAFRFTADRDEAQDAVQDAFVYFAGKFPGFVLSARMTTFLYAVIKSTSLALVRKRRRVTHDEMALSQAAAPPEDAPAGSIRAELAMVMAALPEAQREVVLMRFVDDFSLEEIGQGLSIPIGTVKSRLHHALATLRASPVTRRYFEKSDEH